MEITFKKNKENLLREVLLKSADLDEDISDSNIEIGEYFVEDKFITISPRCVRCDLCVKECPINTITSPSFFKRSRIKDNCVKCEICPQTCPVSCIYVLETEATISDNKIDNVDNENNTLNAVDFYTADFNSVEYTLKEKKIPHRVLRMEDISIDLSTCDSCGNCIKFCPTNAISMNLDNSLGIDKKLCIGCGSCSNLCPLDAIELKRFLGPVIETKELLINQDTCVECYLCEESCPVEAISLANGKVVLDDDKCIKCNVCSTRCPVSALTLNYLDK